MKEPRLEDVAQRQIIRICIEALIRSRPKDQRTEGNPVSARYMPG